MGLGRRSRTARAATAVEDSVGGAVGSAADSVAAGARAAKRPFTAARAKRVIGVGKAVLPLLAPYALAAAGVVRASWDARRAAQLGVEPGELPTYAGRGGALHARISRMAEAAAEVGTGRGSTPAAEATAFADRTRGRLTDLAVAVRAAEQMPTTRRKAAFRAISGELDRIEIDVLTRLGVVT